MTYVVACVLLGQVNFDPFGSPRRMAGPLSEPVVIYLPADWAQPVELDLDFDPLGDAPAAEDEDPVHWDVKLAPRPDGVPGKDPPQEPRPAWAKTKTRTKEFTYEPVETNEVAVSRERSGRRGLLRGGLFRRGGRCGKGG